MSKNNPTRSERRENERIKMMEYGYKSARERRDYDYESALLRHAIAGTGTVLVALVIVAILYYFVRLY